MNCDDYRAGRLAGEDTPEMAAHAAACPTCGSVADLLEETRSVLTDPAVWQRPGEDLEERIVGAVAGANGDDAPTELHAVETDPRRRIPVIWLAAAAAVVVLGIAVGTLTGRGPDWRIEVPGTEFAPQASAVVEGWSTDAGTRMRVSASGLPPAPAGHVYEMWLTKDRDHVSGGTFRTADSVDLFVGVRRADYPRVWITLEALDGDASPTWDQTVLDTG